MFIFKKTKKNIKNQCCLMVMASPQMMNVAGQAGGNQAYRENFMMRRQPSAGAMTSGGYATNPAMASVMAPSAEGQQCHFPLPPPYRCYCQPAAFHSVNGCCGGGYHSLVAAYGSSRSCPRGL
jgi:hypothetical protein